MIESTVQPPNPLLGLEITSHSRNEAFEKCSKKYELEYIKKERIASHANHFIIGDLCHKSIEDTWTGVHPHPKVALTARWLDFLTKNGVPQLQIELASYAHDISHLYRRAHPDYNGPDRIRKADGSPTSAPHMTKAWKTSLVDLQLDDRKNDLDIKTYTLLGPSFAGVSLADCYAETLAILGDYKDPPQIASVEHIEFPLSHRVFGDDRKVIDVYNPIVLPRTGVLFNAYIDAVVRLVPSLGGGITLIDHKTSKDLPDATKVAHWDQLLKYAWAWAQLQLQVTGVEEWPTHIGINHLRSGTLVLAEVDPDLARWAIERHEEGILAQKAGGYLRRDPFGYNSPCLKFKDGAVDSHCPHLFKCHPLTARKLGLMDPNLGNGFSK